MKYLINKDVTVELDENNGISVRDLSRMMLLLADQKLTIQGEGYDIFADGDNSLVVVYDSALDAEALAKEHDGILYSPLHDTALAQVLMRKFNLQLSSIVTINGNLNPQWKAERLGAFMALDDQYLGLVAPQDEPLAFVHPNPISAIALCSMMAAGIGRTTFIAFNEAGNASLQYMAHENVPTLYKKGLGRTVFPAAELDYYNVCGVPNDVLDDAISKARTQYEAAKAQEKEAAQQAEKEKLVEAPVASEDEVQKDTPAQVPAKTDASEPAPVPEQAPVDADEPAKVVEPVTAADPVVNPAPVVEPQPVVSPAPVAAPAPVESPMTAPAPAPVAVPTQSYEASPSMESAPMPSDSM